MRLILMTATLLATHSDAYGFDHADRTSLAAELQRFEADLQAGRFAAAAERYPPRLSEPPEIPDTIRYLDITFDLETADIKTTASGIDYALLPTETVISRGLGPDTISQSLTLAFQDTGRWYFFELTRNQDASALINAYPDFSTIDFPDLKDTQ